MGIEPFLLIFLIHNLVALTAVWWMRPLMLRFDKIAGLPPTQQSDYYFFCWGWSPVLFLMALYPVWGVLQYAWQVGLRKVS